MILQNDEKICPFCCEVIKKQARRCKHCQADLGGGASGGSSYETAGGEYGFAMGGVGHHIEGGVHITNLSELDEMDETKKGELLALYESQVRGFPEKAQVRFALGLSYLNLHLYEQALVALKQALGKGLREANLYYYIAVASFGGRRPRALSLAKIKEIESYLQAAINLNEKCYHFKFLWAIVKQDYYLANGLRVAPPSAEELMEYAQNYTLEPSEIRVLFSHLSLPMEVKANYLVKLEELT